MAYPRRRLHFGRVLVFVACLVLVLVYAWSLRPEEPVQVGVRDKKGGLNRDPSRDQGKTGPPVVLPVNRTDIETCIYVDKPEPVPTEPPSTGKKKGKGQYPADLFPLEQRRRGWVALHLFGMVYMFVALAIVCDEFFVPALEVITEKLQISDDVAGATFMAAGGSAPELFTSLIGVFIARSNIGIGTIVGSAVFNILFVIGMCAIFSREMLHLTWWPLFRDVTFYILDLMMLIVFFLDNAIRWWESAMLVSAYICYVTFMKFNSQIEAVVKRGCGRHKSTVQVWSAEQPDKVTEAPPALHAPAPKPKSKAKQDKHRESKPRPDHNLQSKPDPNLDLKPRPDLNLDSKPRLVPDFEPRPRPGLNLESKSRTVPNLQCKPASDPEPEKTEIRRISDPRDQRKPKLQLMCPSSSESWRTMTDVDRTVVDLVMGRPVLQRGGSAASLHNASMRNTIFQLMIHTLDPLTEVKNRMKPLTEVLAVTEENNAVLQDGDQKPEPDPAGAEPSTSQKPDDKLPEKTTEPLYETQIPEESEHSSCSGSSSSSSCSDDEEEEAEEEEEEETAPLTLDWPQTCSKQVSYLVLLPIVLPLWVTLPDVRNSDSRRFFAMTFLGSILWIGIFSYLMVWWAHQVGETVGISEEIMGLTILAAGTSIPDLITSVIVARKGLGDMAVSSSVGSNIFDITVGLPVPWLLFSLTHGGESVTVSSNGLFCAIVLLFLMLLFVIASIAVCRWKMSRTLGLTMFLLYFLFLLLSVLLEDRILTCPVSV